MDNQKVHQMLTSANNEYAIAMKELHRPSEDMVQMAVCLSVKDVLASYLAAYLLYKGANAPAGASILQLLKQCKEIDNDFRNINLSPVICRAETGEVKEMYCLSSGRIKKCFDAAHSVRELVTEKILGKQGIIQ